MATTRKTGTNGKARAPGRGPRPGDVKRLAEVTADLKKARLRRAASAAVRAFVAEIIGTLEGIAEHGGKLCRASREDGPFAGLVGVQLGNALGALEDLSTQFLDAIPVVYYVGDPVSSVLGLAEEE